MPHFPPPSRRSRHTMRAMGHTRSVSLTTGDVSGLETRYSEVDVRRLETAMVKRLTSLALTAWLVDRFHIRIRNVIGHSESLSSPYHKELYKPWAHQTHADWKHADMQTYRAKLRALLREDAGL